MVDILRADDFLLQFLFLALEVGDARRVSMSFVSTRRLPTNHGSRMPRLENA